MRYAYKMKIIGNILGILFGYIFIGAFAYGFINLLKSYNSSSTLIILEFCLFFVCGIVYTILTTYICINVKFKGSTKFEARAKYLKGIFLVSFLLPILPVLVQQFLVQHAELFLIAFIVISIIGMIPTFVKQFNGKISYWEARIEGTKRLIIIIILMIFISGLCNLLNLPIMK